jgi:hypothetical protein
MFEKTTPARPRDGPSNVRRERSAAHPLDKIAYCQLLINAQIGGNRRRRSNRAKTRSIAPLTPMDMVSYMLDGAGTVMVP